MAAGGTAHAAFGRSASLVVLVLALLAAVIGGVASYVQRQTSSGLRWGLALPVAVLAAGVAVLAFRYLIAPQHATEFVMGVLLLAGAIAMVRVAAQVGRRRLPSS